MKKYIDIIHLGWFWAVNRGKEKEYFTKNYYPSDVYSDEEKPPRLLGEVIMFNFLAQQPELLGRLINHALQNRTTIEYTVFGVSPKDIKMSDTPHLLYEFIWAGFSTYMFTIKEIANLFHISIEDVRNRYDEFDKEYEDKNDGT